MFRQRTFFLFQKLIYFSQNGLQNVNPRSIFYTKQRLKNEFLSFKIIDHDISKTYFFSHIIPEKLCSTEKHAIHISNNIKGFHKGLKSRWGPQI